MGNCNAFDEQNQPLFNSADLGKYLGIDDIKNNFKDFSSYYTRPRSVLKGVGLTTSLVRIKNPYDILIDWDGSAENHLKNRRQLP